MKRGELTWTGGEDVGMSGPRRPVRRAELGWSAPALALLALVVAVPLVWLVWLSLHGGVGARGGFVGLENYLGVLGSAPWWTSIGTTTVVMVTLTAAQLALGLAFAIALWHLSILWWPARWLALVPAGVGLVVGATAGRTAVEGGFIASWFGLDDGGATTALIGVVVGEMWRTTGLVVVLLHAGLSRVPTSLLDAALVDGATSWQRWRRVIWPALTPTLLAVLAYRALDSWRLLDGPLLVREPGSFRTTGSALVADNAFGSFQTGPAAAAGVVLIVCSALIGVAALLLSRTVRTR
ncbi:MAG: sugar ABC transporter permease [Aeromicrobium sp.]|uniref:carbohydrate ABC transporter permease n=1 Tax=Aeromicrobium sp. TaxID=1871063 RepID=UPI0039E50296